MDITTYAVLNKKIKEVENDAVSNSIKFNELNEQYEHIATKVGDETQGLVKDVNDLKNNQGNSITNKKLIAKYVHSSNKVIQPTFFDLNTGVFTCPNHGLTGNEKLMINFDITNFTTIKNIPYELFLVFDSTTWAYFTPVIADENTFTLDGYTYDIDKNASVDISKFWFEELGVDSITISNISNLSEINEMEIITYGSKTITYGLNLKCLNNTIISPYRYWTDQVGIDLIPLGTEHLFSTRGINLGCLTKTVIKNGVADTEVSKDLITIDTTKYTDNWNITHSTYNITQYIDGELNFKDSFEINVSGRCNIRNGFKVLIYDTGVR